MKMVVENEINVRINKYSNRKTFYIDFLDKDSLWKYQKTQLYSFKENQTERWREKEKKNMTNANEFLWH